MVQIEDQSKRRYFLGVGVRSEKFHSLSAIGRWGGILMTVHKLRARLESSEVTMPGHFFSSIRAASMPVGILTMMTLFMLLILPRFAATKILHRWGRTGQPMPQLKKVLVISVVGNYLIR